MRNTTAMDALAAALAKAQAAMRPARMSGKNPHFKSRFATLGDVWDACREPLAAHGLAVVQTVEQADDTGLTVVTTILHGSGQWLAGDVRIPIAKLDAQSVGSAISYGRRYGLAAALGIVADEDDDGNAATNRAATPAPARQDPPRPKADGGVRMPFGKSKGKLLSELPIETLQATVKWCTEDDGKRAKFADILADIYAELERRQPIEADEEGTY